ncbi:extracellular solute-binding protein [Streptomyces sp. M19]
MRPAIDAFKKKYPGIEVQYANKKAPDLVTQLNVEQAADRVSFDVSNAGGLTVLPSQGMAAKVDWADYGVPSGQVFADDLVYVWAVPKVWAYNTHAVSKADVPARWNDLLGPRWKGGKLTVESRGSFMTVWAQDPSRAPAPVSTTPPDSPRCTPLRREHHAGPREHRLRPDAGGHRPRQPRAGGPGQGAPIAVAPVGPTNANKSYLFVPKGSPHPAAGRLLTAFLASEEGQSALVDTYNSIIPTDTDCTDAATNRVIGALCEAGVEWFSETDIKQYEQFSAFFPRSKRPWGPTSTDGRHRRTTARGGWPPQAVDSPAHPWRLQRCSLAPSPPRARAPSAGTASGSTYAPGAGTAS